MKVAKMYCQRCDNVFVSINKDAGCLICGSNTATIIGEKVKNKFTVKEWYVSKE